MKAIEKILEANVPFLTRTRSIRYMCASQNVLSVQTRLNNSLDFYNGQSVPLCKGQDNGKLEGHVTVVCHIKDKKPALNLMLFLKP